MNAVKANTEEHVHAGNVCNGVRYLAGNAGDYRWVKCPRTNPSPLLHLLGDEVQDTNEVQNTFAMLRENRRRLKSEGLSNRAIDSINGAFAKEIAASRRLNMETEIMTDKDRIAALEARVQRMKGAYNQLVAFANSLESRIEALEGKGKQ